ncbi:MAG: hypothetical protein AAGC67_13375 [Myxococcota bacterium]
MADGSTVGPDAGSGAQGAGVSPLLGVALLVAFSPALVDLGLHLWQTPWARGALLVPLLLWRVARVDRPAAAPRSGRAIAVAVVAAALVLQGLAIGGDVLRLARTGVVIAFAVVLWASGRVGPRSAVLALFLLPVPSLVARALSPGLETAMGTAAGALPWLAFDATLHRLAFEADGGRLPVVALDGGLALCVGMAAVGWARAILTGRDLVSGIRGATLWAFMGLPCQGACLALLASLFSLGVLGPEAARVGLDHAGVAALVLATILGLTQLGGAGESAGVATREGHVPC